MFQDYTIEQLETWKDAKFWIEAAKRDVQSGDRVNAAISYKRAENYISKIEAFIK